MRTISTEQIEKLINLQQIAAEGIQSKAIMKSIGGRVKALDKQIKESQTLISAETEQLNELKKNYREFEADSQDNLALIERNREKMRAVKTQKEYQALLKGIDELRERNSEIEDRMIEILDVIEQKETQVTALKQQYENLEATVKAEKKSIMQEEQQSRKILEDLEARIDKIAQHIAPDLLSLYKRVSKHNNSLAIIPAKDSVCTGCNLNIPPQMYNELKQSQSIEICPHCQRMIYCER